MGHPGHCKSERKVAETSYGCGKLPAGKSDVKGVRFNFRVRVRNRRPPRSAWPACKWTRRLDLSGTAFEGTSTRSDAEPARSEQVGDVTDQSCAQIADLAQACLEVPEALEDLGVRLLLTRGELEHLETPDVDP